MSRLGDRLLDWSGARLGVPELGDAVRELHARRVESHGTSAARRWYRRQVGTAVARAAVASVPGRGAAALAASEVRRAGRRFVRTPLHALSFAAVVGVGITTVAFMAQTRTDMMAPDRGLDVDARLVVWLTDEGGPTPLIPLSGAEPWLREPPAAMAAVVPIWPARHIVETPEGLLQMGGERVLPGHFAALGGTLRMGRDLAGADEVVLSHPLWTSRFEGDRDVVGRTVTLSGRSVRVVGVSAPGFHGPLCCVAPDYWVTAGVEEAAPAPARIVVVDPRDATAAEAWLDRARAPVDPTLRAALDHPSAHHFGGAGGYVARVLGVLMVLSVVVWFSTLLSGANLVVSDALARRSETRTRRALGARRIHTVVHVLVETGWLAVLAAGAAVAATAALARIVPWLLPIVGRTSYIQVQVGPDALGVAAGAAALSAVACTLPVLATTLRARSTEPLLERAPGAGRFAAVGLGLQVTLAVALVVVTGQFLAGIRALDGEFVGFRRGGVAVHFVRPAAAEQDPAGESLVDALEAGAPGSVALTARVPVYGAARDSVDLGDGRRVYAAVERVTSGFFGLVGTRLTAGQAATAPDEAVVSRDLGVGVGSTVTVADSVALRVVGVVESATWGTGEVRPTVYRGWGSLPVGSAVLLVDPGGPTAGVGALLPALARQGLALQPFETLDGLLVRSRVLSVFLTRLAGAFGVVALLVALGGVHAHFVRWVRSAERNLAIRRALGAPFPRLGRTVVGAALRSVATGAVAGAGVGLLAGRLLAAVLGVEAATPALAVGGAVCVAAVSLLALIGPLTRLRRVAPLALLRPG